MNLFKPSKTMVQTILLILLSLNVYCRCLWSVTHWYFRRTPGEAMLILLLT